MPPEAGAAAAPRSPAMAAGKARLAAAILVAYARVRLLLLRGGLPRTVAVLRSRRGSRAVALDHREVARLTRAVVRVLRLLPTDSRCLVRALVVLAVLADRGTEVELVIGVLPGPTFAAHAWVELGGTPLLEPGRAGGGRLVEL